MEIPRMPLRAGLYAINLWCEVNGLQADWLQEAAQLEVEEGDFYGTGVVAPDTYGPFLVEHRFRCEPQPAVSEAVEVKEGA